MNQRLVSHVQVYAAAGWRVFPILPGSKRPYRGSHGVNDSTTDGVRIAELWAAHPGASIGVDCGRSGIVAIDIDGAAGEASLAALVRAHGPLPATVEAITPGGGRHLLFRRPAGAIRSRQGVWESIDVRADGGYIVVAPSLHPSGRTYQWAPGASPAERNLAPMPGWLVAGCRTFAGAPGGGASGMTPERMGELIAARVHAYLRAAG